jgi:sec-independent protein translocase protein TatA
MNFGNLGFTEILILVLILVLFFGAKRIPEIGASIGQGIKEFKRSLSLKDGGERAEGDLPPPSTGSALPGAPGGEPKRLSQ